MSCFQSLPASRCPELGLSDLDSVREVPTDYASSATCSLELRLVESEEHTAALGLPVYQGVFFPAAASGLASVTVRSALPIVELVPQAVPAVLEALDGLKSEWRFPVTSTLSVPELHLPHPVVVEAVVLRIVLRFPDRPYLVVLSHCCLVAVPETVVVCCWVVPVAKDCHVLMARECLMISIDSSVHSSMVEAVEDSRAVAKVPSG